MRDLDSAFLETTQHQALYNSTTQIQFDIRDSVHTKGGSTWQSGVLRNSQALTAWRQLAALAPITRAPPHLLVAVYGNRAPSDIVSDSLVWILLQIKGVR